MAMRIQPKSQLVYLVLLALSVAGAYLLNDRFGYTPLLFLLLLAPIDILCAHRARRCVHSLNPPPFRETRRGEPVVFSCAYRNGSRFLVCRLAVSLRLTGPKGLKFDPGKASFDLAPGATATLRISIAPNHIGVYRMRMQKVRVYGPIGLFGMKLPEGRPAASAVVPSRGEAAARGAEVQGGRDENASRAAQGGSSAGSYNGVREYAPGDLLRNIHWKLTAHTRQMMTRLYEEEEDFVTVAVDLRPAGGPAEEALCAHDQLCESAYRSVCGCVGQGAKVRLVFFDGERLRTLWVKSEAGLPEAAVSLASAEPADADVTGAAGVLPAAGEVLVVSAHLDEELARRLSGFPGKGRRVLFHSIVPAQFKPEAPSACFNDLLEHDVECRIIKAPPARRTRQENLRIERITTGTGEKNEKIFHSRQSR